MAKKIIDLDTIDRSTPEGNAAWFKAFIDNGMIQSPIEARIVNKLIKALKDAGDPIVKVYDGGEMVKVRTRRDIQEQVFNLDECRLITKSGGWVFLVMGNEWDVISDYTLDIEKAIQPVNDYVDKHN